MSTNPTNPEPEELTDSSKYIRTYAKDLAAASGKPATAPAKPLAPTPPPALLPTTDGVGLPEIDESLITQDKLHVTGDEPVDLSDSATSGPTSVFEKVPTPGPSANPERDSVLARLRARANGGTPMTVPTTPPPTPVASPAPAPHFEEPKPEVPRMPPVSKEPRPAPPPPPPPVPAKPIPEAPSRFHSYSTDFSERIDDKRASTFSVLAAQADRKQPTSTRVSNTGLSIKPSTIAATLLVVFGIGLLGAGATYFLTRPGAVAIAPGVPSLIAADESTELEGVSGPELMRALRDAANEPLVSGNVLVTYMASASTTAKGLPIRQPAPGGTLIKSLPLLAPDILIRNIKPESTVGVVHAGSETRPFFILSVSSFERTFAGMLAWEPDMRAALSTLYPEYANAPISETATSTPEFASAPTTFVDAIVRNHDVRVLRDAGGRSLMLYGYHGKDTLIIARDEEAFLELYTRLDAAAR